MVNLVFFCYGYNKAIGINIDYICVDYIHFHEVPANKIVTYANFRKENSKLTLKYTITVRKLNKSVINCTV